MDVINIVCRDNRACCCDNEGSSPRAFLWGVWMPPERSIWRTGGCSLCSPAPFPFTADIDLFLPPSCWEELGPQTGKDSRWLPEVGCCKLQDESVLTLNSALWTVGQGARTQGIRGLSLSELHLAFPFPIWLHHQTSRDHGRSRRGGHEKCQLCLTQLLAPRVESSKSFCFIGKLLRNCAVFAAALWLW